MVQLGNLSLPRAAVQKPPLTRAAYNALQGNKFNSNPNSDEE